MRELWKKSIIPVLMFTLSIIMVQNAATQEPYEDVQVGLVFPAFLSDGFIGTSAAFYVKLCVQTEMTSEDPITGKGGFGHGLAYFIPAPMAETSHEQAARLARINGLQGTVWGFATELVDGIAIQPFLTLSEKYEDFRRVRLEFWRINVGGSSIELGPPRRFVSFRAETIPLDKIDEFGSPSGLKFCLMDGGQCTSFSDYQVTRVRERRTDGVIVYRNQKEYFLPFPNSSVIESEAVAYSGIFIAYARGNFNQVVIMVDHYIRKHEPSAAMIDAYIYKAAALARMNMFDQARDTISSALALNPLNRPTLRYAMMVEMAASGSRNAQSDKYFRVISSNYNLETEFDRFYLNLMQ